MKSAQMPYKSPFYNAKGGRFSEFSFRHYLELAVAAFFSAFMLVSSGSCFAQGYPAWLSAGDDMPKTFIEFHDANKDGKVSKSEFVGLDIEFKKWDKNKDGFIELSEVPTEITAIAEEIKRVIKEGMMGGSSGGEGGAPGGK